MQHVNIKISGKVQGVFYRQSAQKKARELGITGWVRNEEDGTVYVEAEGEEQDLEKFIKWCRKGSGGASVSNLDYNFVKDVQGFQDFTIRY